MLKKLILIDGAAGTGKTDLVEYVKNRYHNANMLRKYTTRPFREEEKNSNLDLIFLSEEEFAKKNFGDKNKYPYGGHLYGFNEDELRASLEKYEFTLVIIRSIQIIKRLQADYKYKAIVVPIYIYTDRNLVVERLKSDGYTNDKIDVRLKRSESCWEDYLENDYFETPIIINNSNKVDFHRKINQIFTSNIVKENEKYIYINPSVKFELISALRGYKKEIQSKLNKHPYEKNVFLMMKFRDNNKVTYEYIKKELERQGYNCVRADEKEWKNITGTSFNPMAVVYCCKYGIALFDEAEEGAYYNPNVAYELGMMQTQNKRCLILKHYSLPNPPFDIVKDLYQVYNKEIEFEKILSDWISSLEGN